MSQYGLMIMSLPKMEGEPKMNVIELFYPCGICGKKVESQKMIDHLQGSYRDPLHKSEYSLKESAQLAYAWEEQILEELLNSVRIQYELSRR